MYCNNCSKEYDSASKFCPYCGTPNEARAPKQAEYAPPAPSHQPVNYTQPPVAPQPNPYDIPSVLLCILSFFEPFLGLVLYLSWYREYPKRAKGVGIAALISVILKVLGLIIFAILSTTVFAVFFEDLIWVIEDLVEEVLWYF